MFDFKKNQHKALFFARKVLSKINYKILITFISLLFVCTSIYGNLEDLANQVITFKVIIWLICGFIFSFLSIIVNAYAWKFLIDSIGIESRKLNLIKIFLNTNIQKYLPGGIWHFVSRYNILRKEFSTEKSIESILLEPLLMLVAGLILIPVSDFNIFILIICWSSTLLFLVRFREFLIKKLRKIKANIFINRNKLIDYNYIQNRQITTVISYPYKPIFVEVLFILVRFFGFLSCLNAFSVGTLISQLKLISSFSLAWVIGLVVPAAPGGLGVFESVILFSLSSQMPEASLLASLLCYRVVSTMSDIFAALVYPVIKLLKI